MGVVYKIIQINTFDIHLLLNNSRNNKAELLLAYIAVIIRLRIYYIGIPSLVIFRFILDLLLDLILDLLLGLILDFFYF